MKPTAPSSGDAWPVATNNRLVDPQALARINRRLNAAPTAPWLHTEVARRMAQRLSIVLQKPRRVLDWGAHLGGGKDLLRQAYPQAAIVLAEADTARCQATQQVLAKPWWHAATWLGQAPQVQVFDGVAKGSADLLWSNMALHGQADPPSTFAAWHRALDVDGFLMFSTLGPGSLPQLQALYRQQAWPPPFAPFVDMHDLGDMMVQAGFADPVMDQEHVTLTWPNAQALLQELRQLGGNAHSARAQGLCTPRWHSRLLDAVNTMANADGRLALQFEVVYGHAFKPLPRPRVTANTTLAAEDLQRMARSPRGPR